MTAELPRDCARGVKQNAQGYRIHWTGYKLTSTRPRRHPALRHPDEHARQPGRDARHHDGDSSLYDLMDNASADEIPTCRSSRRTRGEPSARPNSSPRPSGGAWYPPEDSATSSAVPPINANFKDNFAGRLIRLRGADKIVPLSSVIAAIQIVRLLRRRTTTSARSSSRRARKNANAGQYHPTDNNRRQKPGKQVRKPKIRNRRTNSPLRFAMNSTD